MKSSCFLPPLRLPGIRPGTRMTCKTHKENSMNRWHLGLGLFIFIAASTVPSVGVAQTLEGEIRDVQVRQADAWNRHDEAASARLFTEDGDVVNVVGWWWKGRSEIESKLTAAYAFVFERARSRSRKCR